MKSFFDWMKSHFKVLIGILIGMIAFGVYVVMFINRHRPLYENMEQMPLSEWFWVSGFILLPALIMIYPWIINIKKKKYLDVILLTAASMLYSIGMFLVFYAYLSSQVYVALPEHPTTGDFVAYMWLTGEIRSQALVIQGIGSGVIMLTFFMNLFVQAFREKLQHREISAV